jgi:hypothetical protein
MAIVALKAKPKKKITPISRLLGGNTLPNENFCELLLKSAESKV